MPLHEPGCGGADAHNQIKRAFGKYSTEVLDKWNLRIFVAGTRSQKRLLNDLQRPWRLPIELRANGFGVLAPGLEIPTNGMKH